MTEDYPETVRDVFNRRGIDIDATPIDKLMANDRLGYDVAYAMEHENYGDRY